MTRSTSMAAEPDHAASSHCLTLNGAAKGALLQGLTWPNGVTFPR